MTRNQSFAISIMHALSPGRDVSVKYDALGDCLEFSYRKIEGKADECLEAVTKTVTIYHHYDNATAQKCLDHIKGVIIEMEKRYEQ